MSSTSSSPQSDSADFVGAWAESFSQIFGQLAGTPVPCTIAQRADAAPAADDDLWIVCTSSGALRGEQSFRIPALAAVRLAQQFMNQAAITEPEVNPAETGSEPRTVLTPEHGEAVVELMRQVAGIATDAVKPRWGEVQFHTDRAPGPPSWPASSIFCLRSGDDSALPLLVELHLSAALAATLRSERPEPPPPAAPPVPPLSPPSGGSVQNDHHQENHGHLDRLMDVQLAMTLRFGSRRLPLREILEFCPGTVIELDRQIDEPVDLLLHGKLVARGEVVVVDGNYGLRVTEVVSAGG